MCRGLSESHEFMSNWESLEDIDMACKNEKLRERLKAAHLQGEHGPRPRGSHSN